MGSFSSLLQLCRRIDGKGFKAYKDLLGSYDTGQWTLGIDHVQGDPFAAPSKIRLRVPHDYAHFPDTLWSNRVREVGFRDYVTRVIHRLIRNVCVGPRGMGKSGLILIDVGGQEVLERTAVVVDSHGVEARLEIGLPAQGRTILGKQAQKMLCEELPCLVEQGLRWDRIPQEDCRAFVDQVENFMSIQSQLESRGFVAFVADGSVLPRMSGISDAPLRGAHSRDFLAPDSLSVTFELPHPIESDSGSSRLVRGMGIPTGVTLIVGGGYHGKSTLLQALQRGVYPHIPGDGREWVVTSPNAVKIRAEDGRRVAQVDISGFVDGLPQGISTANFSTENASGSTSQAAGIIEALEVGARVLLMDEDTCATNFMVRDSRMQALVPKDYEPITPFLDRVGQLNRQFGVSTILVMGGCGDYFHVADTVLMMKEYGIEDKTLEAKQVAQSFPLERKGETSDSMPYLSHRIPHGESLHAIKGKYEGKISTFSTHELGYGRETLDLKGVEQLVDESQTRAVGCAIYYAARSCMDGALTVSETIEKILDSIDREGLDVLSPFFARGKHPGNFARPRKYEIAAALNRLRSVKMTHKT